MMTYIRPFGQMFGQKTVNVTVGTASANVAVPAPNIGVRSVRLVNSGSNLIFVEFGRDNTIVATTTGSMPMLPNTERIFLLPNDVTYVAAISGTAGNTLYVTVGEGI